MKKSRNEIRELREAAERGESEAMLELARAYDGGDGVPSNSRTAYRWYLHAAEAGHVDAMYAVGLSLVEGEGIEADPASGADWLERASDSGQGLACWRLALCLVEGVGRERNVELAMQTARDGWDRTREPLCASLLADLYDEELGDESTAVAWYELAAENGEPDSMVVLGYRHRFGEGVAQDLARAVSWYRRAVEHDHELALSNLAVCYENGEGVERNLREAFRLRARAAELGHEASAVWLGFAYLDGAGVDADKVHGLQLLEEFSASGEVAYELGLRFLEGCSAIEADAREGIDWFRRAAEVGEPRAILHLGVLYWNGEGVAQDRAVAVKYYLRAARMRDEHAWFNLALAYEHGEGVDRSPDKADRCLRRAARLGHGRAACALATHLLAGSERERCSALSVLDAAIRDEDPDALFLAAECARDGLGRDADPREALRLFQLAQVRGRDARVEIGNLRRALKG